MTRIGSLCSGYGGLEMALAAHLGPAATVAWHVEYDKHPSMILAHHHPDTPNHGDVKLTDWERVEPVEWLTAGYPCQPFSHAGKRAGSDDPRHLWPGVARAIGVLRPQGVLLENVGGHLTLGLDAVLWDLASLGYDATWGVVRAADAGAPHGRARLFIVATEARVGQLAGPAVEHDGLLVAAERGLRPAADAAAGDAPSAARRGPKLEHLRPGPCAAPEPGESTGPVAWGTYEPAISRWAAILGRPAPRPTEPGRSGERLSPRFVEWMMGLPDGWVTAVPGLPRNAQLKALGNGVVPQQALLALSVLHPVGVAA